MLERFTDRARKVLALANQEAQRFQHEYIGTEHILLGLVKEGAGIGATALKDLGIDLRKVRLEVEKIVKIGPEVVTLHTIPKTPGAKRVIQMSLDEARKLNHNYVGTEHILLGLLTEVDGVAYQVLVNLGATVEAVRAQVLLLLGPSEEEAAASPIKQMSQAEAYRSLLEQAMELTAKNGTDIVASFAQVVADYRKARLAEMG